LDLGEFRNLIAAVRGEIGKAVQGQDAIIDLVLISIFAGGHCLVEGPPGTAKTLLARSVSAAMALQYRRIQFTPDLMPGDVLGVNLFNFQTNQFHLTCLLLPLFVSGAAPIASGLPSTRHPETSSCRRLPRSTRRRVCCAYRVMMAG